MKDKKAFTRRIGDFLAGKGFYVVLFICTAVIGVSAWILLSTGSKIDTSDTESIISAPLNGQDVMVTSNYNVSDVPIADLIGKQPEVSAKPTDTGKASAAPTQDKTDNKPAAEGEGDSAPAMAKQLTYMWPAIGDIINVYSVEELIYSQTMADWRTHDGIDIKSLIGTKVMAAADGTVSDIVNDDLFGTTIIIDHGNGLKSVYANLAPSVVVEKGDKVAMGAVIGAVGDTALGETCEVAHLHFGMTKDDAPVDPIKYLPKN